MKFFTFLFALGFSLPVLAQPQATEFHKAYGPRFQSRHLGNPADKRRPVDPVHRWNQVALDATGLDHTPVQPGENRVFGEQLGPGRASRAMAIVHIAIFDTINAVTGQYNSYTGIDSVPHPISIRAALAQAAHDTLVALFRSQKPIFDQ